MNIKHLLLLWHFYLVNWNWLWQFETILCMYVRIIKMNKRKICLRKKMRTNILNYKASKSTSLTSYNIRNIFLLFSCHFFSFVYANLQIYHIVDQNIVNHITGALFYKYLLISFCLISFLFSFVPSLLS